MNIERIYKIEKLPSKDYIIDSFTIVTEDDKVKELLVHDCWHPNASNDPNCEKKIKASFEPPKNQKFCLPTQLINANITKDNISNIMNILNVTLKTYNYEHSYWVKWDGFIFNE